MQEAARKAARDAEDEGDDHKDDGGATDPHDGDGGLRTSRARSRKALEEALLNAEEDARAGGEAAAAALAAERETAQKALKVRPFASTIHFLEQLCEAP